MKNKPSIKATLLLIKSVITSNYIQVDPKSYVCENCDKVTNDYGRWKIIQKSDGSFCLENQGTRTTAVFLMDKFQPNKKFSVWDPSRNSCHNTDVWESFAVEKGAKKYRIRHFSSNRRYISVSSLDRASIKEAGEFDFEAYTIKYLFKNDSKKKKRKIRSEKMI